MAKSSKLRLTLDAHASIGFLAGSTLDLKSGCNVALVQKGRIGARIWRADDQSSGEGMSFVTADIGSGSDMIVMISVTHDVQSAADAYRRKFLPGVGKTLHATPLAGPGAAVVAGGQHAADLADQITREIRTAREDQDGIVHLFAACPNALIFYLGQQHRGIGPVIVYEYDFDRRGNKTYQPSFLMD
jgi:hypothetical protein